MKKRLALVLVLVLMASAATTALASPFADVPADHWAYDSVAELAAAGLIEGYPDGTYGGARMMTRYEAAMVFARALNRLESQIDNNNLLPELDKIKAELMAEIEAQMAAADKPVVEAIETKIIEQRIDEQALARIRANEIALDAIEGDMAYLEARMLGLVDGLRYDMSQLEAQHGVEVEVEQPSMDEIEALIAAKVQEGLLNVASGVKETTIVERVVSTTPELTKQDVEFIAEALIRKQVQDVERTVQENRDLIVGLVEWVDELDTEVAVLKDDVTGLKEDVAGLQTSVTKLEGRPYLSGELTLKGEYKVPGKDAADKDLPKNYVFTQSGTLNLNIKASDTTDVKAILGYGITAGTLEDKLSNYRVEVTSTTPVNKVVVGKLVKGDLAPYKNRYVLAEAAYQFGGFGKINIIDDLTLDLFAGQVTAADPKVVYNNMQAAAALQYKFMPEIGLRLSGALQKPAGAMFENYAAGVGLFGTVAGITYGGDFAMDFNAKEKNYLAVVTAEAKFEPVTIDGKFIYQEKDYKIANQLVDAKRKFGVEGGVKAALELGEVGVNLAGRAYYEGGAHVENAAQDTVLAFKLDADATVDFFAPITLAARFVGNTTGDATAEMKTNIFAKLSLDEKPTHGLRYGAFASYEKNVLTDVLWKNIDKFTGKDIAKFGANVGYGLVWNGAQVDLDYAANFGMPIVPENDPKEDNTLNHKVDVKYGFTDNVTLTFGGSVKQTLSDPMVNDFGYNAGLTVKF